MSGWRQRLGPWAGPVLSRPRLLAASCLGVVIGLLAPASLRGSTRILLGWDGAVLTWLVLVVVMMLRSDNATMQNRAEEDEGALTILGLTIVAAVASLAAIVMELHSVSGPGAAGDKPATIGLASATILLSWLFVHTMFAIHYAHDFYGGPDDDPGGDRRGIKVPGTEQPDYWDFMYFAFNLGAAAQTSDVVVEASRTRRYVLVHTILSFLFNTTILALAINVGAGLI